MPDYVYRLESKFNTFKHTGLPPHPIGSVSLSAIEIAIKILLSINKEDLLKFY